nr:allantoate deiminase [Quercus suber]
MTWDVKLLSMNYLIRCIKYVRGVLFHASLIHDANAVVCDSELSSQLKSAAYSALRKMASNIQDETPALMSGAGHDAMAMSHLTKVIPL